MKVEVTQRTGDTVRIDDRISVKVVRIGFDQAHLGFEAPRDVSIMRRELLDRRSPAVAGKDGGK